MEQSLSPRVTGDNEMQEWTRLGRLCSPDNSRNTGPFSVAVDREEHGTSSGSDHSGEYPPPQGHAPFSFPSLSKMQSTQYLMSIVSKHAYCQCRLPCRPACWIHSRQGHLFYFVPGRRPSASGRIPQAAKARLHRTILLPPSLSSHHSQGFL